MNTAPPGPQIHTEDVAVFSSPPVNVGEDKISWTQYRPTYMSNAENSSIQFFIPGNSTQYINLAESTLYVQLSITKEDLTDFSTEKEETGLPIDNILHSMWSSVDIKLNHTLASTSGTDYNYKAFLETLLSYDRSTKQIQFANSGFSGESGNFAQTHPNLPPFNHGLKQRWTWFKDVAIVEFMGPLMSDICNQEKLILPGVDIDIKLYPARDEFRLITNPIGLKCKLTIEDIRLDVCKVMVSDQVMLGHDAALQISDAIYPFQRTDVRTFNISEGSFGTNLEDIWQGEVPTRLVVGMVKSQAYNGDFNLNPYRFEHFDLSQIGFYVNGEPTPRPPMQFDVASGVYLQGLVSLYRVSDKLMENTDIGISRSSYREGYNLYGFDVDPTTSADFRYIGRPKEGHTKLEIRFKKGLDFPVTLIVYATFPEIMTIDKPRNVRLQIKDKILQKRGLTGS